MDVIFSAVDLKKVFKLRKRSISLGSHKLVKAVDGVTFKVQTGETFGIVGETGCGKTTLARLIMQLEKPSSGHMFFKEVDTTSLKHKQLKDLRRHVQMVFQDPYSSLNPVKSIFYTIAEPLWVHKILKSNNEVKEKVRQTLEMVGLPSSDEMLSKRPDELSGGERQRVGIAKALVLDPEFIVADEPVSMLDASVRAEIIGLLLRSKAKNNLTYVFITHELDVAYAICDRIAVMYAGKIVELGTVNEIISQPLHPYTKLLVEAVPPLHPQEGDTDWGKSIGEGESAYYIEQPNGCKFQGRCKYVTDICIQTEPDLKEIASNHSLACFLD